MNTALRAKIDADLLIDLANFGRTDAGLKIDWSRGCMEGRGIRHLGGYTESNSSVSIINSHGQEIGGGWVNFFYHEADDFLRAFWSGLSFYEVRCSKEPPPIEEHDYFRMPLHVWRSLPEKYRVGKTRETINWYNYIEEGERSYCQGSDVGDPSRKSRSPQHPPQDLTRSPLRIEIDQQLLAELKHYGIDEPYLRVNWSGACIEREVIYHRGERVESASFVSVDRPDGRSVALGSVNFFFNEADEYLHPFWSLLVFYASEDSPRPGENIEEHHYARIPFHVWKTLPERYQSGTTPWTITLYNRRG